MKRVYITFICLLLTNVMANQKDNKIVMPENMPLHTKVLWGNKGLFRKLEIGPKTRQDELQLRIKMLQLHQKIALGTLGLFYYQSYLGNQLLEDPQYRERHATMSKVVWLSYMASAGLSYLAPPGMVYSKNINSMKIHRYLSWIHFSGMAILPVLGKNISNPQNDYSSALQLHQNVAYVTLFTMSLSALLSIFPY